MCICVSLRCDHTILYGNSSFLRMHSRRCRVEMVIYLYVVDCRNGHFMWSILGILLLPETDHNTSRGPACAVLLFSPCFVGRCNMGRGRNCRSRDTATFYPLVRTRVLSHAHLFGKHRLPLVVQFYLKKYALSTWPTLAAKGFIARCDRSSRFSESEAFNSFGKCGDKVKPSTFFRCIRHRRRTLADPRLHTFRTSEIPCLEPFVLVFRGRSISVPRKMW